MEHGGTPVRATRILVAGNAVLDITPVFPGGVRDAFRECFVPGRLITMNGVDIHAGGACCNTGAALRFFGVDVSIAARIGCDAFGDILEKLVEQTGIRGGLIRTEDAGTSYTVVLSPPRTDRIFLHDPGAGDFFGADDIRNALGGQIDLFHFGYPPLMRRMYSDEGNELVAMFEYVRSHGIPSSLDMAMVTGDAPAASADWTAILGRVLPLIDFFLPSLEEICFFIDPVRYRSFKARSKDGGGIPDDLSVSEDIAPLADRLIRMGAGVVLIKCGDYGIYYRGGSAGRLSATAKRLGVSVGDIAEKRGFMRAFRADRVVSANGAGDAAIAGFLAGVTRGNAREDCVRLAVAAGSASVGGFDAISGLLPIEKLEARIRDGWPTGREIRD